MMKQWGWKAVCCRDLPEYEKWCQQVSLKESLLCETGGGEAFVDEGQKIFFQFMQNRKASSNVISGRLSSLLNQGYAPEEIARAFAIAWLTEQQIMYLPARPFSENKWLALWLPWFMALLTTLTAVTMGLWAYRDGLAVFVFWSAFLAIPFVFLGWLYSLGFGFFLRWLDRFMARERVHPHAVLISESNSKYACFVAEMASHKASVSSGIAIKDRSDELISCRNHFKRFYLMYKSLTAFNTITHRNLKYQPVDGYGFAARITSVPVGAGELIDLAFSYPVIFPLEGSVQLTALLGFEERNVFVDNEGAWIAGKVPEAVQHYPFALAQLEGHEEGTMVLALDVDAPHFLNNTGHDLCTAEGKLSPFVQQIQSKLMAWEQGRVASQYVLSELETSGVLVQKNVTVRASKNKPDIFNGFRMVDADLLVQQDDATLAKWVRNGTMQAAYLHLASLKHFERLSF